MGDDTNNILVKDIMSKGVLSADASMNVNEAAKMMEDSKVGAIIVMEDNKPAGIITERDFAVKIVAHAYPITTPIEKIMSAPIIGIKSQESVWTVAALMFTNKVRKIPVFDENNVVGMVTATDLVNQFALSTEEDIKKMYFQSITKIFAQEHYV